MTNISWNEIQDRATEFAAEWHDKQRISSERGEAQSFWSGFLSIYGVDRRRHGAFFEYAIKKGSGKQGYIDMFWPGKLLAEQKAPGRDLEKAGIQAYEYLETMPDHDLPEAIVVSDFVTFQFIRLDTREKIEFKLEDLPKHVKLFGFLINQASRHLAEESPVNRQAAESMANLHNQLRDDNYEGHDLEVLLVRLVFCMFADDSGIFDHGVLQDYLINRTNEDGSDLGPRLMQIFQALNTPIDKRQSSLDEIIASLPYVNGGLFAESIQSPNFTSAMRTELLIAMRLDWSKVSPAIFGSMFQGVMDEKERRNLGAHYTSEKNILRVIKPLFLDDLYVEFATANAAGPRKKFEELRKLQDKIAELKFLDPACGCGNFLVITYRELRKLEHKIVAILAKNVDQQDMFASAGEGVGSLKVNVDQMYGIEIEEFPSLIAQTALWLTDHQMNMEYSHQSGRMFKRLPLTTSATIVNESALTIDWKEVIASNDLDYILGNPPFLGKQYQTKEQKEAFADAWVGVNGAGVLDFVTAWHKKAAEYIQNTNIKVALVSTNSISQGEQVGILWNELYSKGMQLDFAHRTFKWNNDAKGIAAVHCVIEGFSANGVSQKRIFDYPDIKGEPIESFAQNINPYLLDAPSITLQKRRKPLCDVPEVSYGNMPNDGGNLLLSQIEADDLIQQEPEAKKWIHRFVMGNEFINNISRYCLWLVDISPQELRNLPLVAGRIQAVRETRLASTRPTTRELATTPSLFGEIRQPSSRYLAIPCVSSENRDYIPMDFLDADIIAGNKVFTVQNADSYTFGILTSRIHMAWMRVTAGRLKSDYNYTNQLVYNNFIWPEVTETQKAEISNLAQNILDARAEFPGASLADLYDPLTMPPSLAKAHKALDKAVDKLYQSKPFLSDADRVALLFEKYRDTLNEH
jgi:hypothetical protein